MTKSIPEIVEEFNDKFPSRNPDVEPKITDWLTQNLTAERQRCEEMVEMNKRKGWKGYMIVDPETDNYCYSNPMLDKREAERFLKAFDIKSLKIIEVDILQTLTNPNNTK